MNEDWKENAFINALRSSAEGAPRNLVARALPDAKDRNEDLASSDLSSLLLAAGASNPFLAALWVMVHKWDAANGAADWAGDTSPSTEQRRDIICERLGLDSAGAACLLESLAHISRRDHRDHEGLAAVVQPLTS